MAALRMASKIRNLPGAKLRTATSFKNYPFKIILGAKVDLVPLLSTPVSLIEWIALFPHLSLLLVVIHFHYC